MALKDELTTGPLAAEIAPFLKTGAVDDINAILNRRDISVTGSISVNAFAMWAASTGMRAIIQEQADLTSSPLRSIALTLLDLLHGNLNPQSLDLSNAVNLDMLATWVKAGFITAQQEADLITLSQKKISRAEQLVMSINQTDIKSAIWSDTGVRAI